MGNRFEISVVSDDDEWARERIEDAINESEGLKSCSPLLMTKADSGN